MTTITQEWLEEGLGHPLRAVMERLRWTTVYGTFVECEPPGFTRGICVYRTKNESLLLLIRTDDPLFGGEDPNPETYLEATISGLVYRNRFGVLRAGQVPFPFD
jgi:hypothetical protein